MCRPLSQSYKTHGTCVVRDNEENISLTLNGGKIRVSPYDDLNRNRKELSFERHANFHHIFPLYQKRRTSFKALLRTFTMRSTETEKKRDREEVKERKRQ